MKYRSKPWEGGVQITASPDFNGERHQNTFTCCHCNCVTVVPFQAKSEECGGFCRLCFKPTCPRCTENGVCTPFEKRVEAMEKAAMNERIRGY